ncbi:hypothetical protein TKK_0002382 [Trichogramma kaykai]
MESTIKSKSFSASRDERTFRAFLYTQMEMFDVGEEEAVDFEICEGKIYLCTDSGKRHEIKEISEETKRVVVATIEKLAETVDADKNKSSLGTSDSEQTPVSMQGATAIGSTANVNLSGNILDNEKLDQTGMAMFADLQARVLGKSTPKIKKTIVFKSSKGKNNGLNELPTDLEKDMENNGEKIQKEIELSEKVHGLAINLQERQLNVERVLFQKIAQLEAQNKKLEVATMSESSSDSSVRPQNVHLNRDFISKTLRDEISHIKASNGELDLSDKIQIEVSNRVGSGRREYKLTSEVTFELFVDFLTSEHTLCDLMYVIDSKITRKNSLSPEQLEKDKIRVRDIIINRIDMSYYTKVSHLRDPIDLLKKIKELKFSETSITPSVLRKRLNSIKYQPHREKASEFWDRFDDLVRMYNRIPDVQKLTEIDIRDALFDAIVHALPGVRDTQFFFKHSANRDMTIDELKDYIIRQESYKLEQQEIEKSSRPPPSARQADTRNDNRLCYTCGNKGHIAQDCTRNGPMCYRCRRYEGHMSKECLYSDDEIESFKRRGNDSKLYARDRSGFTNKRKASHSGHKSSKRPKMSNGKSVKGLQDRAKTEAKDKPTKSRAGKKKANSTSTRDTIFGSDSRNYEQTLESVIGLTREVGGPGFEDVQEFEILEIVLPSEEFLTAEETEDILQRPTEEKTEDKSEIESLEKHFHTFTVKKIINVLEELMTQAVAEDPVLTRSMHFKHICSTAAQIYEDLYKDYQRKIKQSRITDFFSQ